jgi:hypothetical protein
VPVPAIFTRGRWECSDFKEANGPESQILEFNCFEKHVNPISNHTTPIAETAPTTSHFPPIQGPAGQQHAIVTAISSITHHCDGSLSPSQSTITTIGSNSNNGVESNILVNCTHDGYGYSF